MRKANKERAKTRLSRTDIKKALNDKHTGNFDKMINHDLYEFRIKKYLYEKGKISKKGFLFNSDIYKLPLGKKNAKGEILIDDGILEIFDRFLLAKNFATEGDVMTAFLVDTSDALYNIIKENTLEERKLSEQEYIQVFNNAYLEVEAGIIDHEISLYLSDKPDLQELIAEHNLKLHKKQTNEKRE